MSETTLDRADQALRVTALETLEDVRAVVPDWSDLLERALDAEPFLSPEWLLPWWESFGVGRLRVLTARVGGRLVGLAPLSFRRERFLRAERDVVRLWGNEYCPRPNVVLDASSAQEAAAALVRGLLSSGPRWDVARLGPLEVESATTRALLSALREFGLRSGIRLAHASPYLPLPDSWEDLVGQLSSSFRETVRRKVRKCERRGDVTVAFAGEHGADADAAFAISEHTWQHAEGTGIGSTPQLDRFFRGMADGAAKRGWLDMAYLSIAGAPTSFEFNLRFHDKIYNLKLGYRDDSAELSPGIVLKQHVLQRAIAGGMSEYDMLGAAEPYKLHWTNRVRQLGELWIVRRGFVPRLAHLLYFRVRPFVAQRLPWVLALKRRVFRALGRHTRT